LSKIISDKKIRIKYDKKKPNGTPRKVLDISLAKKYGWYPKTKLTDAILKTYDHFLKIEK
jgi:GDP-L-fucose synthase